MRRGYEASEVSIFAASLSCRLRLGIEATSEHGEVPYEGPSRVLASLRV